MDDPALTPLDVATRVAAWHNRHPFARRVDVKDVHSLGVVALPWSTAGADRPDTRLNRWKARVQPLLSRLPRWGRAEAAPPHGGLRPAFSEVFMPGVRTDRIAEFVRRHGQVDSPAPDHWPMRQIHSDADVTDTWLYVLTAAVGNDAVRSRLLLSSGPRPIVFGRRLYDRRRAIVILAAAALALGGLIGVGLWARARPTATPDSPTTAASAPAPQAACSPSSEAAPPSPSASTALAVDAAAASAPDPAASASTPPDDPAAVGTQAAAAASEAAVTASAPEDAPPSTSAPPAETAASTVQHAMPARQDEDRRARATPPGPAAPRPARTSDPRPSEAPPNASTLSELLTPDRPADARRAAARHLALMSRGARSRAAAEALLPRMQAAARDINVDPDGRDVHIEVIQGKAGWHAVWWPFEDRRAATEARWALALKGVTVDLVDF